MEEQMTSIKEWYDIHGRPAEAYKDMNPGEM